MVAKAAHQVMQRVGRQLVCRIGGGTGEVDHPAALTLRNLVQFVLEDQIGLARRTVDQRQVLSRQVERLEQSPHRSDADSARDQQHLWSSPTTLGEGTVRTLGQNEVPWPQLLKRTRASSQGLDRDPELIAAERGGQRERKR